MAPYVEFLSTRSDGSQEVVGSARLDPDGEVILVGVSQNLREELEAGFNTGKAWKLVTPADGILFLEALKVRYNGSMLRATAVKRS
jgi:hypothetical protein